jgi:archaemetzincin
MKGGGRWSPVHFESDLIESLETSFAAILSMLQNSFPHRPLWCLATWLSAAFFVGTLVAFTDDDSIESIKQKQYEIVLPAEEVDFVRKRPPKPGEWMAHFEESCQTLEDYKTRDARYRADRQRRNIVLQPLGKFTKDQRKLLESLREYAEVFFQLPTRIASNVALPSPETNSLGRILPEAERHGNTDRQFDAAKIIDKILLRKIPDDAVVYIGITMEDLYAPNMNYLFGLGSFDKRCGVYSLARYYPEFWNVAPDAGTHLLVLRRAFKVLSHETSHVFGLRHCVLYECVMNGSNSLRETDTFPVHECPICQRKLQWNLKFDSKKRFASLKDFYLKNGLKDESEWMRNRIQHWTPD